MISVDLDRLDEQEQENYLINNENFYQHLFEKNPIPMWIYDLNSLNFLIVNEAAVKNYGYSSNEFLNMSLMDIRPSEDIPSLLSNILNSSTISQESGVWRHKKKNGEIIFAKINSHKVSYNGKEARCVTALDVTEKIIDKKSIVQESATLRSIIESTDDLIFSVDKNYCYTSFNASHKIQIKNSFNIEIKIGDSFFDPLNNEDKLNAKENFDQALQGKSFRKTVTSSDESFQRVHFDVLHNPIKDEKGSIIGVSVFAKNITEQKKYYEKVKYLTQAVEQSPVSIMITDTFGSIEYVNKKVVDISGYRIEELIGKNPRILSSGEKTIAEYNLLWQTIRSGKIWKGEFHNKKKDGSLYWEYEVISPILNEEGEIIKFLAVKEDITEQKRIHNELIESKNKAEELNRIKSALLSNMSHELRTPLVGILGFADILENLLEDPELKSMANSILNSGKRLLNTLSSLLSLTEFESRKSKIDFVETDINQICEDIFTSTKNHSSNQKIEFKISLCKHSLSSNINIRLFREALTQILKNAETYTNDGFVLLRTDIITSPSSGTSYGVLEIEDTGIGIPDDKLNVVFDEFRQVSEGIGRVFEGTGLGLTLAKKYIESIGGKIKLESELGRGTRVIIQLPLTINPNFRNPSSILVTKDNNDNLVQSVQTSSQKKILIVEDEDINRIFLEKCVAKLGMYESVSNGIDAINIASKKQYDLILMDINLGNSINGLETVDRLRKIESYEKTPVVALTAYVDPEMVEKIIANGFSHYLAKPFLFYELKNLVKDIFKEA